MKLWSAPIILMVLISLFGGQKPIRGPKPKPTPTPSPTATPTPTPTPTPSPSPTPTATPTPTPANFLTVISANISHGQGTDNGFRSPAHTIPDADIIIAQEVSTGDIPGWDADFLNRGMVRAIYAMNPNSSGQGDGQAIWYKPSRVTLNRAESHELSNGFIGWDGTPVDRAAAAVDITVGGMSLVVSDVHLCHSRCADTQADVSTTGYSWKREAQLNELNTWLDATFPGRPRVVGGDFNLTKSFLKRSGGFQIDLMTANHFELWELGLSTGTAFTDWLDMDSNGLPDMTIQEPRTADTRQIDFFFFSRNSNLGLQRIDILDLRMPCPHALVADGSSLPSCSPEVVKQWNIPEDFGPRATDHNLVRAIISLN